MNQTVIRLYLMILVGILVVAAGFIPRGTSRAASLGRSFVVAVLGLLFLLFAFHSAGAVETLVVTEEAAYVQERFPGRTWGEVVWTRIDLANGRREVEEAPPGREPAPTSGLPTRRAGLRNRFAWPEA